MTAELYESQLHAILDRILPLYVHQLVVADRQTHGLTTTAVLRSVAAGSLNVGRHALRRTPVHGSFSDHSIANWSVGNMKRSGSIYSHITELEAKADVAVDRQPAGSWSTTR